METMTADFFTKSKSKKEQLYEWIKLRKEVRTSEIQKWGSENYCNRSMRNARQLATEGLIERIPKVEKDFRFHDCHEEIWRIK